MMLISWLVHQIISITIWGTRLY